jgi:hypothetical protein
VRRPFIPVPGFVLPIAGMFIDLARRLGIDTPIDSNQARLGAHHIYFDGSKAWAELAEPQIDMRQSLQDTYHWYQEHGYI